MIYEGNKSLESSVLPEDMGMEYLTINSTGIVLVNCGSKRRRIRKSTKFYGIVCAIVEENDYQIVADADRLTVCLTGKKRDRIPEPEPVVDVTIEDEPPPPPQKRRRVVLTRKLVLDVYRSQRENFLNTVTSVLSLAKDCDTHIQID